jgi:hypothetical protein
MPSAGYPELTSTFVIARKIASGQSVGVVANDADASVWMPDRFSRPRTVVPVPAR